MKLPYGVDGQGEQVEGEPADLKEEIEEEERELKSGRSRAYQEYSNKAHQQPTGPGIQKTNKLKFKFYPLLHFETLQWSRI